MKKTIGFFVIILLILPGIGLGKEENFYIPPFFGSLNFSNPQIVSLEAGGIFRFSKQSYQAIRAAIEPGVMGIKTSLGYGFQDFQQMGGSSISLNASYLRTWHKPWTTDPNLNFIGTELRINFIFFTFKIGYYKELNATRDLFSFTFGFGVL